MNKSIKPNNNWFYKQTIKIILRLETESFIWIN